MVQYVIAEDHGRAVASGDTNPPTTETCHFIGRARVKNASVKLVNSVGSYLLQLRCSRKYDVVTLAVAIGSGVALRSFRWVASFTSPKKVSEFVANVL